MSECSTTKHNYSFSDFIIVCNKTDTSLEGKNKYALMTNGNEAVGEWVWVEESFKTDLN